jgi:hypothetical protein
MEPSPKILSNKSSYAKIIPLAQSQRPLGTSPATKKEFDLNFSPLIPLFFLIYSSNLIESCFIWRNLLVHENDKISGIKMDGETLDD